MSTNRTIPGYWRTTAFTVVYLLFELVFNARLLDIAGTVPNQDDLHDIEVFGRSLSGIGASLILWRTLGERRKSFSVPLLLLVILLVAPGVYWGQKFLVDYLVNRATAQERKNASYLAAVSAATLRHAAELKGLNLSDANYGSPEGKAFFALFPALAFSSPGVIEKLDSQMDTLMLRALRKEVGPPEYVYNTYYVPMTNEIRVLYNSEYLPSTRMLGDPSKLRERAWTDFQYQLARQHINPKTASRFVHDQVVRQLNQRNIRVPDDWALDDKEGFMNALPRGSSAQEVFSKEASRILGFPSSLPPGLSWERFARHLDIQRLIRMKIKSKVPDLDVGREPVDLDASFAAFSTKIYSPGVTRAAHEKVQALRRDSKTYEIQGSNYELGRSAMHAVLVPPLALLFSLFFGLANIIGLVIGLLPIAGRLALAVRCAAFVAILTVPFMLVNPITQSTVYRHLEERVAIGGRPVAWALRWVAQTAPPSLPIYVRHRPSLKLE